MSQAGITSARSVPMFAKYKFIALDMVSGSVIVFSLTINSLLRGAFCCFPIISLIIDQDFRRLFLLCRSCSE